MSALIDLAWITLIVALFSGGCWLLWTETSQAWSEWRDGS